MVQTSSTAGMPEHGGVLIADDEKGILTVFKYILREAFAACRIDAAADGQRAVEAFVKHHHDVVILDLHMPVMDGVEAFHAIRDACEEAECNLPAVVFFSGYAPPASLVPMLENSARHVFLPKPVSGDRLVETVRACMGSHGGSG